MTTSHKKAPTFSLKDQLFNKAKVTTLAQQIAAVYPDFATKTFITDVTRAFPQLELKERISHIVDMFDRHLPDDYLTSSKILVQALPPELDPSLTDDDFGTFIWVTASEYVARHGVSKKHLKHSLRCLHSMTKRFSVEGAIRPFLRDFPSETLAALDTWASDPHYHVRRLCSEGVRPLLPWCMRVVVPTDRIISLLDRLHADPTRFVTRSVANCLNDIAKSEPDVVVETLARWQQLAQQDATELDWMTRHALRTLVKQGHAGAMQLLGYDPQPQCTVSKFKIATPTVPLGETLEFGFDLTANKAGRYVMDYQIGFVNARGKLGYKVFKLANKSLKKGETISLTKKHPLKPQTTRTLYAGKHELVLQINGVKFDTGSFDLQI